MPFDCFLQIQGIKGDSADAKHKGWIEVEAYSHRISQAVGGHASAQGVHTGGRADHDDFTIEKRLDSATPILAQYCCTAKHIPEASMELCRAMGDKTIFMVYKFKDLIVSSCSPAGSTVSEDPLPLEEISFRYGQITWEYTPTDITGGGKTGAAVRAGWSLLENREM